jgi:hypothetical protein
MANSPRFCVVLFALGLSIYLWEMHFGVALPVAIVTLCGMGIYVASTILPFLYEFCPYTTATSRLAKALSNALKNTAGNGVSFSFKQDIVTSRALRWLIDYCEDPQSVDVALQAIAGADKNLPLEPLMQCNARLMISRRLTAGSAYAKDYDLMFRRYARALSCLQQSDNSLDKKEWTDDVQELRKKICDLQINTEG